MFVFKMCVHESIVRSNSTLWSSWHDVVKCFLNVSEWLLRSVWTGHLSLWPITLNVPFRMTLYNLLQCNSTWTVSFPFVNPLIVLGSFRRRDSAYLYVSMRTWPMSSSIDLISADVCASSPTCNSKMFICVVTVNMNLVNRYIPLSKQIKHL